MQASMLGDQGKSPQNSGRGRMNDQWQVIGTTVRKLDIGNKETAHFFIMLAPADELPGEGSATDFHGLHDRQPNRAHGKSPSATLASNS